MTMTQKTEFIREKLQEQVRTDIAKATSESEKIEMAFKYGRTLDGMRIFKVIPKPLLIKFGLN